MFYFYNQLLLFPSFKVVWFALAIISHKKIINPTIVFNTEKLLLINETRNCLFLVVTV